MKRDGKQAVISELKELFTANQNFYIADTSGLTVAEVSKLRRMCFKQGVKLKVAKKIMLHFWLNLVVLHIFYFKQFS